MGTILSIETQKHADKPISANDAYFISKQVIEMSTKLDQEIKNTPVSNNVQVNQLYSQAYEDCKAKVVLSMISGNTNAMCLNIGIENEKTLRNLGYNLQPTPVMDHFANPVPPYYKLRVSWKPK
jgi:hypothetical protein